MEEWLANSTTDEAGTRSDYLDICYIKRIIRKEFAIRAESS